MRKKRIKLGIAVAVGLIAAAVAAVILTLDGPLTAASQSAQVALSISERLGAALGIPPDSIVKDATTPVLAGADAVLKFPGGVAEVDTKTGRLIALVNRGGLETGKLPFLSLSELDLRVTQFASQVGWNEQALKAAGFRPEGEGDLLEDMSEYQKEWVGYTSQGIRTDGLIEIRADARTGRVVSFLYHPGVGDVPVDASGAISESAAVDIGRTVVAQRASEQGGPAVDGYDLKQSLLKLTAAPALTGGAPRLVWVIQLVGEDAAGSPLGGTVYIDALSGQVIQYLAF